MAVDGDRHRQVDRPVRDLTIPDLDVNGIDEHDWIDGVEGSVLPLGHTVHHLVGDGGDGLLRHVGAVHLGQVGADLAVGQPLGRQRQDHVVDPGQAPLPFPHDLRLERARSVPRHADLDRTDVGEHRLGPAAVTSVPAAPTGRVVLVVADVVGDLTVQGRLEDPLGQLLQQPTLAGELQPVTTSPIDQHRDQLLIRDRTHQPGGRLLPRGDLGRHLASLP